MIWYIGPREVTWCRARGATARHNASRGRALELPWERKRRKWATLSPLESAAMSVGHLLPSFLFSSLLALLSLCFSFPSFDSSVCLGLSHRTNQGFIRFGLNEMRFIYTYILLTHHGDALINMRGILKLFNSQIDYVNSGSHMSSCMYLGNVLRIDNARRCSFMFGIASEFGVFQNNRRMIQLLIAPKLSIRLFRFYANFVFFLNR